MKRIVGIILLLVLTNVVCAEYDSANSVQQTSDGGYILAGRTDSYGAGRSDFWLVKTDSNGNKEWDKTFGGDKYDSAKSVQQTSDGGYILAGRTDSYGAGFHDFWLVKTDSNGNKEWDKTFEGELWNEANSVQQTSDSGYILAGVTESYDGQLVNRDVCLVKTDSNGNKEWDKTFGGTSQDEANSVQQTSDGGYILAGDTESYGAGRSDFWLVKTDSNGNKEWDKTFGRADSDSASSVQQTSDDGYILAGGTESHTTGSRVFYVWLVKTDSNGNKEWDKTFGRADYDSASSVQQTSDGGYIFAGGTYSYGVGRSDVWLVKTDSNGNKEWDKTFGGSDDDSASSVQQTSDGGYIFAGSTHSYGASGSDVWLVKTDSNGNKEWDKTFGGSIFSQPTFLLISGAALLIVLVLLVGKSRRKGQKAPGPTPPTTRPTPPPEPHAAQEAADRGQKQMEMQRLAELRSDASSRLKTAKSMLNKAGQLGIDMSQLNDILAKAEQAYQKENYTHAIDYLKNYFALIDQAEKNKKQLEQMQKSAGEQIQSANFSLQKAEKLGVAVKHAKELNLKAQSAFDVNDYSSAMSYANQSNDAAKKLIDESKPSISIELPSKMEYEAWKHRDLTITNTGSAHAVAITITFLTALEMREFEVIKRLDVGEQKTLNVNIRPTEKGEVPVDYSIGFKDLMGRDYKIKDTFNLQIDIDAEVLKSIVDHERGEIPRSTVPTTQFTTLRTVWDPLDKDFVWDAGKPEEYGELPRIKEWIRNKNPNIYWFLLKIINHTDHPVTEWNVTLYTEQALAIAEVHLNEKAVKIVDERFDTNEYKNICIASVSPGYGVNIPANGERRMYFKMKIRCEDALKKKFGISGVVGLGKSPQIEVPIREKRFIYKCIEGDFINMFCGSTDVLASLVMKNLQNSYSREIVQNFTNSFRLIREFEKYCNDRYAESETLIAKLEVIYSSLKAAEPITKEEILPLVEKNLDELRTMGDTVVPNVELQKKYGIRMCEKLIELLHIATSKIK